MRLEANLQQRQELRQILAQQVIQALEILQLPTLELLAQVQQELDQNPTLELKDGEPEVEGDPPAAPEGSSEVEEQQSSLGTLEQLEQLREMSPGSRRLDWEGADKKLEAFQNTPDRPESLQDYLYQQFTLMELSERQREVGHYLIYSIDESGYLGAGLDEIVTGLNRALRERAEAHLAEWRAALSPAEPEAPAGGNGSSPSPSVSDPAGPGLLVSQWRSEITPDTPDGPLKRALLSHLEPFGTLTAPLERILAPLSFSLEEVQSALGLIHRLDPPGVGARDLRECLLMQLKEEDPGHDLKRLLIEQHLEDIQHNRLPKIARESGYAMDSVKKAVTEIAQLNPKPARGFSAESAPTILPDVIVERIDGKYEVRLEDQRLPRLLVSPVYQRFLSDPKVAEAVKDYIRAKIESAKRLINAIGQRQDTLQRVARSIVDAQEGFFEHGVSHLHPLRMQEIADKVGVHVSTVSRAVAGKYMQSPRGIFSMKFFFTGGTEGADGEAHSRMSVITKIKELIEAESGSVPLSDAEIVQKLKTQGLTIARRTVTKYRKALRMPSSRERKQY